MKKTIKNRKGFTLVEMLLSLAIICMIGGVIGGVCVSISNSFVTTYNIDDSADYALLYAKAFENSFLDCTQGAGSKGKTWSWYIDNPKGISGAPLLKVKKPSAAATNVFTPKFIGNSSTPSKWSVIMFYAVEEKTASGAEETFNSVLVKYRIYIKDNYATISYIQQYYYKDDGTMMSADEKAKVKKQYEKIKSQAESGKIKFADKCKDFEKNATNYKSGSTKYTTTWDKTSEDGKKIMELKEGELTFLETDSAIVLLQRQKIDYEDAGIKTYRKTILISYKFDEFTKDLVKKAESDKSVSFNQTAFDKFGSATRDFSNLSIPTNYNYY